MDIKWPRRRSPRARPGVSARSEAGVTLLELVVTMTVILGTVLATVTVVDATGRATLRQERRTTAAALAAAEIESLRAEPFDDLGFEPTEVDYVASFEGDATVTLGTPGPQPPTESVTVDGVDYEIRRHITWRSVPLSGGGTEDEGYKRLTVIVSWDDGNGTQDVRLDSGVAPSGLASTSTCVDVGTDTAALTGVVNTYLEGSASVAAGDTQVTVGSSGGASTPISAGDLLLVIQMVGTNAGTYEYAIATSSSTGGALGVSSTGVAGGLVNAYSRAGSDRFQIVRVPTYVSATLGAGLTGSAWNGTIGGVVAVDVTRTLTGAGQTISANGLGYTATVANSNTAATRLLPGDRGAGGGGLVMLRTGSLSGAMTITADGTNGGVQGGDGGTVVVANGGSLTGLTVSARGGSGTTTGGSGGTVITSSSPGSVMVTGGAAPSPGAAGQTSSTLASSALVGMETAIGCEPAITMVMSTSTPTVSNITGGTATYTVTATNSADRGTATGGTFTVTLPSGFTYSSTGTVTLNGGATRTSTSNPSGGSATPSWGAFELPAGSSVEITFNAAVAVSVASGTYGSSARLSYGTAAGSATAWWFAATGTGEDVTTQLFSCANPETDAVPSGNLTVNTYYPMSSSTAAGSTLLPVGASAGASTAIAAGDLLLVIQMQDATIDYTNSSDYGDGSGGATGSGATAVGGSGTYEYVLATSAVSGGVVTIAGRGAGGGLLNSYSVAAPTSSRGARRAQVVRVPTYPALTLSNTWSALAWNGSVGGVLAVDVAGTLSLSSGVLSADSAGFRGGRGSSSNGSSSTIWVESSSGNTGGKGEGVAGTPRYVYDGTSVTDTGVEGLPGGPHGRGAPAGAGGGGNGRGSGGGGAGGGAGGIGGENPAQGLGAVGGSATAGAVGQALPGSGGGGAGKGSSGDGSGHGGNGGGLVLVRAVSVAGTGTVDVDGATGSGAGGGGGGGGTAILTTASSGMSGLTVNARGGAGVVQTGGAGGGGGGGGVVLTTGAPAAATVTGAVLVGGGAAGANGTSATTATLASTPGIPLGAGCQPAISVTKTTATASALRVQGATASWTITLTNLTGRPTAASISVSDTLPSGFTFASTSSPVLAGGATRTSTADPAVGSTTPSWGSFSIPGGGSVSITFTADIGSSAGVGTYQNSASGSGTSGAGSVMVAYASSYGSGEDVAVGAVHSILGPQASTDAMGPSRTIDTAPGAGLSGVVNSYYPGTTSASVGSRTIGVGTRAGATTNIAAGDLLLVVQMQDGSISSSNSDAYGDGVAGGDGSGAITFSNAGRYEYVVATSAVSSGSVSIQGDGPTGGLRYAYTAAAASGSAGAMTFQVIRVPVYPSASLNASGPTALAWNGSTGGVVAFDVTGALTLNTSTIDASGAGFRGGGRRAVSGAANLTFAATWASNVGGSKGEGPAGTPRLVYGSSLTDTGTDGYPGGSALRGAPATAGGGGGSSAGGGGGGSNAGAGGTGGNTSSAPASAGGGFGGAAVAADVMRLLPGGGGGAGDGDGTGSSPQSSGSAGGGVVMVRVGSLSGTGTARANGANAPATTGDGGGGGGAGGTVFFEVADGVTTGLTLEAKGGAGADVSGAYGAGGGGGGGAVFASGTPASTSVVGGSAGSGGNAGVSAGAAGTVTTGMIVWLNPGPRLGMTPWSSSEQLETADNRTLVTRALPTTFDSTRRVDVDLTLDALPSTALSLAGGPTVVSARLRFASTGTAGTSCAYVEIRRATDDSLLASGGGLGTSVAPLACVTGTTPQTFVLDSPSRTWSAAELADLRLRVVFNSTDSMPVELDRAVASFSWQDRTWLTQPTSVVDRSTSASPITYTSSLVSTGGTNRPVAPRGVPASFSSSRYIDLYFQGGLASDASVSSAVLSLNWRGVGGAAGNQLCFYLDVRSGGSSIGTVGSSGSPTCRTGSSSATDTLTLPALTAAQLDDLTVRFIVRGDAAFTSLELDQATLDVTWTRS